jgi:Fe(3+) dicitrate transport protein
MSAIEILKGSSQIAFGPQTTSGAINLISTEIPTETVASVNAMTGSFGNTLLHATAGGSLSTDKGQIGYLVEFLNVGSDGFKELDNGGATGFTKSDRLVKLHWDSPASSSITQSLQIKVADVEEQSNETYLGLSVDDFEATPYRRYAASAQDVMNTTQKQIVLTHVIKPFANLELTTDVYRTEFQRNWYKLDRAVDSTGTTIKLGSILDSPEEYSEVFSYLTGGSTAVGAGLDVKANNRSYFAEGVQHKGVFSFEENRLIYGVRAHTDGVDRFQWRDRYSMQDGEMVLATPGVHGTAGNRVESASALAAYVRSTLHFNKFTFTPGLRHENITFERYDYGSGDLERLGDGDFRSNTVSVFLPGAGLNYDLNSNLGAFVGVHRGFIPPGSSPDTEAETSINTELGVRYSSRSLSTQLVIFNNDYENLLGADLSSSGGTGSGDLFNGGSAVARGIELEIAYDPFSDGPFDHLSLPIHLAYTYTDAHFTNEFESDFGAWGDVEVGDALPYLAPHQLSILASLEAEKFSADLSARYTAGMRTVAGQGELIENESTDASTIVDAGVKYNFSETLQFSMGVTNLMDGTYVVSRRPYGLRPGMPRALRLGVRASF